MISQATLDTFDLKYVCTGHIFMNRKTGKLMTIKIKDSSFISDKFSKLNTKMSDSSQIGEIKKNGI